MALAYEELRQKHVADLSARIPEQMHRLTWTREQIRSERERQLRALVKTAQERSPWHSERLGGIDAELLRDEDLERLPVMTKSDLMSNWDEIVTDRQLTLARTEEHLASLTSDAYLLDQYHAVASSGSSGRRGVFVYDWEGWMLYTLLLGRQALKWGMVHPGPAVRVAAAVMAEKATHITSASAQTFTSPTMQAHRLPVTLPLAEIVAGLNELQPTTLIGYPSMLSILAAEARAARLRIVPQRVTAGAEPLLPETRAALEAAWQSPVFNSYGTSEGLIANSCGYSDGMHLCDEATYIEPVDREGHPVSNGQRSAKIYVTNLYNLVLPLIRYEITDQVTVLNVDCPCGSAHRRIGDVEGRLDDIFAYAGDVQIHPHVFRSALGHHQSVLEYQVRQTERGADIAVQLGAELNAKELGLEIEGDLRKAGLPSPEVVIQPVESLDRGASGKLKRFVPVTSSTVARF